MRPSKTMVGLTAAAAFGALISNTALADDSLEDALKKQFDPPSAQTVGSDLEKALKSAFPPNAPPPHTPTSQSVLPALEQALTENYPQTVSEPKSTFPPAPQAHTATVLQQDPSTAHAHQAAEKEAKDSAIDIGVAGTVLVISLALSEVFSGLAGLFLKESTKRKTKPEEQPSEASGISPHQKDRIRKLSHVLKDFAKATQGLDTTLREEAAPLMKVAECLLTLSEKNEFRLPFLDGFIRDFGVIGAHVADYQKLVTSILPNLKMPSL